MSAKVSGLYSFCSTRYLRKKWGIAGYLHSPKRSLYQFWGEILIDLEIGDIDSIFVSQTQNAMFSLFSPDITIMI
jgi:hypothetical protein